MTVAMNRNQSCSIRFRGRLMRGHEDRHEEQRERALDRLDGAGPYRQHRPYPPEAQGDEHREQHEHEHARNPAAHVHAHQEPDGQEDDALHEARARPRRRASRSGAATGRIGVRESRSKKPLSMSRARSAPAVIAPKSEACTSGNANAKSRYESVRETGDARGGVQAARRLWRRTSSGTAAPRR